MYHMPEPLVFPHAKILFLTFCTVERLIPNYSISKLYIYNYSYVLQFV